jgi:hypothetical protein
MPYKIRLTNIPQNTKDIPTSIREVGKRSTPKIDLKSDSVSDPPVHGATNFKYSTSKVDLSKKGLRIQLDTETDRVLFIVDVPGERSRVFGTLTETLEYMKENSDI